MTLFTIRFIKRMGIFSALLYILLDVLVKMYITGVEIDFKSSVTPIYITFILAPLVRATVISILAVVFTRNLRMSAIMHFPKNEVRFYLIYLGIYSVIPIVYSVYLYNYSTPFYSEALAEAINKVSIHNYTEEYFGKLCAQLNDVHSKCRTNQIFALIIGCAAEISVLGLSVIKLLRVYRNPKKPVKRRI